MNAPRRGFPREEFARRLEAAQRAMHAARFDALLLTTEPNVRYFSGFFTQFWESPTRPWFLLLPAEGMPVAVIPEIGRAGMARTWVEDIRTWPSPRPEDDGVSLLCECIKSLPRRFGRLGMTLGAESMLRMPANDFAALRENLRGISIEIADAAPLIHEQRMIKSQLEIEKMRHICGIAADAFAALPGFARAGMTEMEICRRMRVDLLERGADASPYLIAASGRGGYDNIIMGPGERKLGGGDLLVIDTGSTWDGYFCDFDRNFAFGGADAAARAAYDCVWRATEAGLGAARAGATTSDLWRAMNRVLGEGGSLGNAVGRLGHGLGMQLTERPSNTAEDATTLRPGMVITLEPGMEFAPGKHMVHEENIVITEDGAELLSRRAAPELPVLDG
ncbi:MAG: Xaa-Pro peptidase family protein [Gammaproteobacteria bacterium]|nr:Xaa-Pro peptidase family protein [Gammaproteobacteria bacterium]